MDERAVKTDMERFYQGMERRWKESFESFASVVAAKVTAAGGMSMERPPILKVDDCPPVSVIVLTHNRPSFVKNFFLQLMSSDYLWDKIEVVVVDDTPSDKNYGPMILGFRDRIAPMAAQLMRSAKYCGTTGSRNSVAAGRPRWFTARRSRRPIRRPVLTSYVPSSWEPPRSLSLMRGAGPHPSILGTQATGWELTRGAINCKLFALV